MRCENRAIIFLLFIGERRQLCGDSMAAAAQQRRRREGHKQNTAAASSVCACVCVRQMLSPAGPHRAAAPLPTLMRQLAFGGWRLNSNYAAPARPPPARSLANARLCAPRRAGSAAKPCHAHCATRCVPNFAPALRRTPAGKRRRCLRNEKARPARPLCTHSNSSCGRTRLLARRTLAMCAHCAQHALGLSRLEICEDRKTCCADGGNWARMFGGRLIRTLVPNFLLTQ